MQKYSTKTIVINLSSAVTNFPVEVEGQVITHISGDVLVNIRLDHRTEDPIPLEPRDSIVFPEGITFQRFFVSGSAGGGTVVLLVAKPDIRVDKGQVYVAGNINVGKDISKMQNTLVNQNTFLFSGHLIPGGSDYGCLQMYNPAANDYDLYMLSARIKVDSATAVRVKAGAYDVNMTGGTGTGTCTYSIARNKYNRVSLSTGFGISYGYKFVAVAPDPTEYLDVYLIDSDGWFEAITQDAVRIPPGYGWVFAIQSVAITYDCVYEAMVVAN